MEIYVTPALRQVLDQNNVTNYLPAYEGESAGLDLYCTGSPKSLNAFRDIQCNSWLIPTGLYINLPKNMVGLILDRSSIAKTLKFRRAGVIDPGYKGEIFVNLVGFDGDTPEIGDKLPVQLVVVPFRSDYKEVTLEEYTTLTSSSKRGSGALGSSDK